MAEVVVGDELTAMSMHGGRLKFMLDSGTATPIHGLKTSDWIGLSLGVICFEAEMMRGSDHSCFGNFLSLGVWYASQC